MHIRRYHPNDKQQTWELHNLALEGTGAHAGNGAWDEDLHAIPANYIEAGGEFLVGVIKGQVIAMGAIKAHSNVKGEIKRMRVHPNYQRRGYGQEMLRALHQSAQQLGMHHLMVETTSVQQAAQRLYSKNGYKLIKERKEGRFQVLCYERVG